MEFLVSCRDSRTIHRLEVDEHGDMKELNKYLVGEDYDSAAICQLVVVNHAKNLVYVGCKPKEDLEGPHIRTFRWDPDTNEYSLVADRIIPTIGSPTYMSLSPSGKFLATASYEGHCIGIHPIDKDGVVGRAKNAWHRLKRAHCAVFRPGTTELWVCCLGSSDIRVFNLNEDTGELEYLRFLMPPCRTGGPRHLAFHPTKPVVYCINELSGLLDVWPVDSDACLQTITILKDRKSVPWSADIGITKDGSVVVATDRTISSIAVFEVLDDGQLKEVGCYETERQPRAICVEENIVLVAGQRSQSVSCYHVTKHGLILLSRCKVGENPIWVSFARKNRSLVLGDLL